MRTNVTNQLLKKRVEVKFVLCVYRNSEKRFDEK